jgi:hypothetical protein
VPSLDPPGGFIPTTPEELTPEWLGPVLTRHGFSAAVESIEFVTLPATTQTSELLRVIPRFQDETTGFAPPLVWKRSASDPARRDAFKDGYAQEVAFYRDIAPRVPVSVPRCFVAAADPISGEHVLLLEDVGPDRRADLIEDVTAEDAAAVLAELAALHASTWGTPPAADDFGRYRPFFEEDAAAGAAYLETVVEGDVRRRNAAYAPAVRRWWAELAAAPQTRIHGDAHARNIVLPRKPGRPVLVDWQGWRTGAAARDVARLLVLGLPAARRREHERELLDGYVAALEARGAAADAGAVEREYRIASALQWGWAVTFVRHERVWDDDTRRAMPELARRAAAAFDDALAWLDRESGQS